MVKSNKELNRAVLIGGIFILCITGVAFTVGALSNVYFVHNPAFAKVSVAAAGGNIDKIIPMYIKNAVSIWFVYIFMFTLLSAAMSTASSQFHAMGTSIGRDLFERGIFKGKSEKYTVTITRLGILFAVLFTVFFGYKLPGSIIAIATAIFFGLRASVFLPSFIGALFWKGMAKAGVISSMLTGFIGTGLWLLFVHKKESAALGLCKFIFGEPALAEFPWTVIDQIIIILPLSLMVAFVVSLFTRKPPKQHIDNCLRHI